MKSGYPEGKTERRQIRGYFFREGIPSGEQPGKQRGGDATARRKQNQGEEMMRFQEKQEGQEKVRISITESDVSSLKQDGGKENVTKR
ncbi:hypothetical protein PUN28_010062 [Cardiocondyla obscurior]|uniref:Uncharacterized protein n=1 Tax=Cardiocondyla obscurior TaxID=286306 RepID=A0AAW2FQC2_9HYME